VKFSRRFRAIFLKGPLFSEVPLAAAPETVSGHHWLVSNMNENLRSDDPPVTSMASPVIWSPVDPWVLSMASH